ncbi:LAO/AO transport system ATPase [Striga asiatica]|uniref:LAO/AO transport system ATPase n=1 Tax=Striga asiatica TaxID=4170 RepID=A0A5A7Q4P1_STRAF|nr:LAO/AO transport system ATPase [Striga asiatica]
MERRISTIFQRATFSGESRRTTFCVRAAHHFPLISQPTTTSRPPSERHPPRERPIRRQHYEFAEQAPAILRHEPPGSGRDSLLERLMKEILGCLCRVKPEYVDSEMAECGAGLISISIIELLHHLSGNGVFADVLGCLISSVSMELYCADPIQVLKVLASAVG